MSIGLGPASRRAMRLLPLALLLTSARRWPLGTLTPTLCGILERVATYQTRAAPRALTCHERYLCDRAHRLGACVRAPEHCRALDPDGAPPDQNRAPREAAH